MSSYQQLAEWLDQLDLALDQLSLNDRNFDRFAFMLIDNVVELVLHQFARDCATENSGWKNFDEPRYKPDIVADALGRRFDRKVKLAKEACLLSHEKAQVANLLHEIRNSVYHKGLRHEGILRSLARAYLDFACRLLESYDPPSWSATSGDRPSQRAAKYIGSKAMGIDQQEVFRAAWVRVREVADLVNWKLVDDLAADISATIDRTTELLDYMVENTPTATTRKDVVLDSQAWSMLFTEPGKAYLNEHAREIGADRHPVKWLAANYPWQVRDDPARTWLKRMQSLSTELNESKALIKYCEFMQQTEHFRELLETAAASLAQHLDEEFEAYRERRFFEGES